MDRKSQIFAPTTSVGGVRRPAKKTSSISSVPSNPAFKKLCDEMKGELNPTVLNSFSYKSEGHIVNISDAKIKAIGKNKKHVAFLISGNETVIDEKQALRDLSESGNTHANDEE